MSIDYTSTELIADIKQRASVPNSQNLITDANFVRFLSGKLHSEIVPIVLSVRENYFVSFQDTVITTTTEATNRYPVPSRAIGMRLKDLKLVDSGGEERDIPHLTYLDKSAGVSESSFSYLENHAGGQHGFFFEGNDVRLFPADAFTGDSLRLYFFRRPNRLVKTSDAGKITAIDTGTNVVTLDNAPTTWTASTTFDVINGQPGFNSRQDDQTITAIAGADLTFSSLPSGMVVGDYVAESGESPIPQIPYEGFPFLAQLGVIKVLEGIGDKSGLAVARDDKITARKDFIQIISPRVEEKPRKTIAHRGLWRTG